MNDDIIKVSDSKALVTAGWDDVPHIESEKKAQLLAATPKHMRDARSKGIPSLGVGAIYPIPEEDIKCKPIGIPAHWKRAYALDVGWRVTAALWAAQDPVDNKIYVYSEYRREEQLPSVHADAIKARGEWIKGCIDPAARQRSQQDGRRLMAQYQQLGLNLSLANNEVEAGIYKVLNLLTNGQLKIFESCPYFFSEYRLYRRELKINEFGMERAIIVKSHDHLVDCLRYIINTFDAIATTKPVPRAHNNDTSPPDSIAGY